MREIYKRIPIETYGDVRVVSCIIRTVAQSINFASFDIANLQLASAEISTNILKYAISGNVSLYLSFDSSEMRLVFEDDGPGIKFPQLALLDGYTTFHEASLGIGLGAANRSVDQLKLTNLKPNGLRVCLVKKIGCRQSIE